MLDLRKQGDQVLADRIFAPQIIFFQCTKLAAPRITKGKERQEIEVTIPRHINENYREDDRSLQEMESAHRSTLKHGPIPRLEYVVS